MKNLEADERPRRVVWNKWHLVIDVCDKFQLAIDKFGTLQVQIHAANAWI